MTSLILAAALGIQIDIGSIVRGARVAAPAEPSRAVCNIKTVSYRFVGTPGTAFRYDGADYRVPDSGSIELIADRRANDYQIGGRNLPLDVWPIDQFGSRTVTLPATN
ncbi:MAG TPA: hypothetical protein VNL91_00155 [Thermoanaerobaculia bacterium]|nr:hypothetical protein [Thermoanaerobaculia bacterium]